MLNRPLLILEIQNYAESLVLCDKLSKTANLKLEHLQTSLGGRLVTLVFSGDTSDCKHAKDVALKTYEGTKLLKVCDTVDRPSQQLLNYFDTGEFYYE